MGREFIKNHELVYASFDKAVRAQKQKLADEFKQKQEAFRVRSKN